MNFRSSLLTILYKKTLVKEGLNNRAQKGSIIVFMYKPLAKKASVTVFN
jgi:hypothetical protein